MKHYPIILYLLFFVIIFSIKIISHPFPFFDWDESIYAEVGREMIAAKSYLVPLWQGQAWLDKPPLVPLFYGIVMLVTPFMQPEVSTRLATLYLSVVALILMYVLYFKVLKETWITTLVIVITSLSSIFLQRAQVLNVDIFLLIGWLGYVVFYRRFWLSLFFIFFAVYSKSLIGFYPMGIMALYGLFEFMRKEITWEAYVRDLRNMSMQAGILLLWHLGMTVKYGSNFLYQHFYESHVKRVTASIESHFGQRTFYIDLLFQEYGRYAFLSLIGGVLIFWQWLRKSMSNNRVLYSVFFLPWFVFLNLTKTKIFWYGHPYLGQIAYLMVYPITLLRRVGLFYYGIIGVILIMLFQQNFFKDTVLDDFYSSRDPHHVIAEEANTSCDELNILIEPEGRTASETLESMNLLISTSRWWGNHPSVVYYFHGKVSFIYTLNELDMLLSDTNDCFVVNENDSEGVLRMNNAAKMSQEKPLILYKTF